MRKLVVSLILTLVIFRTARAEPIHYEQIPTDAGAFMFVDVDRCLQSQLANQSGNQSISVELNYLFGGPVASGIIYSVPREEHSAFVLLLHGNANTRKYLEHKLATDSDALQVKYQNQDIYCTRSAAVNAVLGIRNPRHVPARPSTQSTRKSSFSLGIGNASDAVTGGGLYYIAFVDQQLTIGATDLPAMAEALDVLAGTKPSLADHDPLGLKFDLPVGTLIAAAGLSGHATINPSDFLGEQSNHPPAESSTAAPLEFDLFSSLKGKARLARVDVAENDKSFDVSASVLMIDPASAEQLKNLVIGVKALLSLSREQYKPLIDPLEIQSSGKNVELHWSWPTAKLADLIHLAQGEHDNPISATAPTPK